MEVDFTVAQTECPDVVGEIVDAMSFNLRRKSAADANLDPFAWRWSYRVALYPRATFPGVYISAEPGVRAAPPSPERAFSSGSMSVVLEASFGRVFVTRSLSHDEHALPKTVIERLAAQPRML